MSMRILICLLLLFVAGGATVPASAQINDTAVAPRMLTVFDGIVTGGNAISTTYSEVVLTREWNYADIFITVSDSGDAYVWATPQFSADGVNWTDGAMYGQFETAPNVREWLNPSHMFSRAGDGSTHLSPILAGRYMRIKLDWMLSPHINAKVMFRQ